eukprot:GHVQ01031508.1.p1 GENE.GHVQ01031508.1~~GHVQ01031508.1.p1  ORF type:complete len:575 (+),score=52.60 GHVQ01031508.1:146-1870(+)
MFRINMGSSLSVYPFLLTSLGLLVLSHNLFVQGSLEFPAYRLIQYENGDQMLGSWKAGLDSVVAGLGSRSLYQKTVVARMTHMTQQSLDDLLQRPLAGLLLLVPPYVSTDGPMVHRPRPDAVQGSDVEEQVEAPPCDPDNDVYCRLRSLETMLLSRRINIPIYFAFESDALLGLYGQLRVFSEESIFADMMQSRVSFVSKPPIKPTKLTNLGGDNIFGWIPGKGKPTSGPVLPTIAFVTYYDSFAPAPSMSFGVDGNGSGLIATLELARLFERLYTTVKPAGYNLLFLFTSGSASNFQGLEEWLSNADSKLIDSIEFALCLDTLGGGPLSLQLSRKPKLPNAQKFADLLGRAAKGLGVDFKIQTKKIKIHDPSVPWQHEWLAKHKVVGGTLTRLTQASSIMQRGSILDNRLSPRSVDSLIKNIRVVAEGVTAFIYDVSEDEARIFDGPLAPDTQFVVAWQRLLATTPRFYPLLKAKNSFVQELTKTLNKFLFDVQQKPFRLPPDHLSFYTDQPVQIVAMRTKATGFHLLSLLVIIAYLICLYVILKGPGNLELKKLLSFVFNRFPSGGAKAKTG